LATHTAFAYPEAMRLPKALSDMANLPLEEVLRLAEEQKLPPVERWNPRYCGHSGMRIAQDGSWYHEGSAIRRPELVRLFSRVLRREPDGRYMLVTPGEMLDIDVEDLPFLAVEMMTEGEGQARTLVFRLNTDDPVIAGPEHPIAIAGEPEAPRPNLLVRRALWARLARPVYYELAELALKEAADPPGLWSKGTFFRMDVSA
jgi:uncharacterized protein